MVEDVEELGAELQAEALGEMRVTRDGEIELGEAGAGERIAGDVAVGAGGGRQKRCGVEALLWRARIEDAVEVGVPVGTDGIARVAVAGGVVAELRREGEAGLDGDDGAEWSSRWR